MIDWHETLHQKELLIKQFIDRKTKWKKSENKYWRKEIIVIKLWMFYVSWKQEFQSKW